jgi:hypothetical protein
MTACTSCGKCCGPAHASPEEAKRIKRLLKDSGESWQIPAADHPLDCGFLRLAGEGRFVCAIYEARPWICRAFGVVKQLPCEFFPDSAVVDFPASLAVGMGRMPNSGRLLGEWFEPGYHLRLEAVGLRARKL